jgi:hypothetical protein
LFYEPSVNHLRSSITEKKPSILCFSSTFRVRSFFQGQRLRHSSMFERTTVTISDTLILRDYCLEEKRQKIPTLTNEISHISTSISHATKNGTHHLLPSEAKAASHRVIGGGHRALKLFEYVNIVTPQNIVNTANDVGYPRNEITNPGHPDTSKQVRSLHTHRDNLTI